MVLSRLSRRTSGGRWIPEIDGMRFLAIALVLADHVVVAMSLAVGRTVVQEPFGDSIGLRHPDPLTRVFQHGSVGVLIFFMLSGFVLALPLVRNHRAGGEPLPMWPYFRRRITRIEPPYLIVMTMLVPVAWLVGEHIGVGQYVTSIVYLHGAYYGTGSPLNGVAWSLELEVQFYAMVPALALLLCGGHRVTRRVRIVAIALLATVGQLLGAIVAYTFLGTSIEFFLLGWLLADIYVEDWNEAPATSHRWDVVGISALLVLVVGLAIVQTPLEHAIAPWLVFATGYSLFRSVWFRQALSNRWIATIGGMCYSIYLLHYPLFILLSGWLRPISSLPTPLALAVGCAVLIPLALAVSAAFFVLVERPCMDPAWPERLRARLARTVGRRRPEQVIVLPESALIEEVSVPSS